jgi:hypothetical protein
MKSGGLLEYSAVIIFVESEEPATSIFRVEGISSTV